MKLRTSFFNPTLYRKNITRFAPIWAIYSIILFLYFSVIAGMGTHYIRCLNGADMAVCMAVVNLIYAGVLAVFLFGDLFNTRHCNMLHAFPLRRETIFFTNLASAFTFALVPNFLIGLISLPFMGSGWLVSVGWFLSSILTFLFYMGTALLAVILTGNRLGFLAVYVLINFLSLLFLWFGKTIFMPLLFGIRIPQEPFILFCPTYHILYHGSLVNVTLEGINTMGEYINFATSDSDFTVTFGSGWGYLLICAAIGIVLTALALVLYRKRKLETAGDFISFKVIEPIFLVLFTLGVGGFFQLFSEMFGYGSQYIFLTMGIIVGFFSCLMLLQKTTRVFSIRAFRNFGIFAASLAVLLLVTKLDPLGLTRKIPDSQDIVSVKVGQTYAAADNMWDEIELTDPEDIETIRNVHQFAVNNEYLPDSNDDHVTHLTIGIDYTLKNGKILSRYYSIPVGTEAAEDLRPIFSRIECVARMSEEEFLALEDGIYMIYADDINISINQNSNFDIAALLEAILADCKSGAMVQYTEYHIQTDGNDEYLKDNTYLEIGYTTPDGVSTAMWLTIYEECVNTLAWMAEYNLIP